MVLAASLHHVEDTVEVGDDVGLSLVAVLEVEPHPSDAVRDATDVFFTTNVVDDIPGQGIIAGEVCGPIGVFGRRQFLGGGCGLQHRWFRLDVCHRDFVTGFSWTSINVDVIKFFGGVRHRHHGGGIFTCGLNRLNVHDTDVLPSFHLVPFGDGQSEGFAF